MTTDQSTNQDSPTPNTTNSSQYKPPTPPHHPNSGEDHYYDPLHPNLAMQQNNKRHLNVSIPGMSTGFPNDLHNGSQNHSQNQVTVRPTPESAPVTVTQENGLANTQHTIENIGEHVDNIPTDQSESVSSKEEIPLQEAIEHDIEDKEVSRHVQVRKENITIDDELKRMGVQPVTSTNFPSFRNIKLPIADDKVLVGKKQKLNTSHRWLAEFASYLLWKAHISLKEIHGKVVRIIRK